MKRSLQFLLALSVAGLQSAASIPLDVNDAASILNASATLAFGLQSWYHNNATGVPPELVGLLPQPYYWWEAGAIWGGMVDNWAYTNDTSYESVIQQALIAQAGPQYNYMPPAHYDSLGNDDQAFWGLSALSALEYGFPVPSSNSNSTWLDLGVAVFNTQTARWDTSTCGGGLRWQIFEQNDGYNYKNTISNAGLFLISARLARYTGNQTYVDWAERLWNWTAAIGLIDAQFNVFDGSDANLNCSEIDHTAWTYNAGTLLAGSATLYNFTNGTAPWGERTRGLLSAIATTFFSPYKNATNV